VSRFLFVVPPLTGHVNPTISVARALAARGHRVAWVAHRSRVGPLLPEGAELIPLDDEGLPDPARRPVRGLASLQFLWEEVLVPLARAMFPGVVRAIEAWRPDLLVVDHQAVGGALAARVCDRRWASFCTTSASVSDALAPFPRVKDWLEGLLVDLQRSVGLPAVPDADLSPRRVIVFSTEALVGASAPFPAHFRFVGPSISDRPEREPFPWEALAPGPRVFVSLGTVSADRGQAFYRAVAAAMGELPLQCILAAPPDQLPAPPPNFIVRARVPQLALLATVDAVVCHAGHNTVCEALAQGLPLVLAPIRDDQPVVADQVVRAGAGVRVKFGRVDGPTLRRAVELVLATPGPRAAARRLAEGFRAAGGAPAAARLLEELA
jgi:MGT family glycosyltransferase